MHYFLSAGEASGDLHAARLIEELRKADASARFTFLGGDLMAEAASTAPEIHYRQMAYMGFSEVLRHLPEILSNLKRAKKAISRTRPDALIVVDYPSFNLKLAAYAHSLGIPVYYYISPKVWAWKEYRVKDIKRYFRRVFAILPFEVEFYRRHGMEVSYVGNPSVEEIYDRMKSLPDRSNFIKTYRLTNRPILALVPGSRRGEIKNNLPVMNSVARQHPDLQAIVAGAPGIDPSFYRQFTTLPVVTGCTFELMHFAQAALVTSGTATLECALLNTPQVVCYRANASRLAYNIMKRILKIPFVSLPNLIAGREVIPEMLVHLCTVSNVNERLDAILPGQPGREAQLKGYAEIRERLGESHAAQRTATLIYSDLTNN